jgi:hypothetical protein
MDVGMMMVFTSYGWDNCSDAGVWDEDFGLARLAANPGVDCLWSVPSGLAPPAKPAIFHCTAHDAAITMRAMRLL